LAAQEQRQHRGVVGDDHRTWDAGHRGGYRFVRATGRASWYDDPGAEGVGETSQTAREWRTLVLEDIRACVARVHGGALKDDRVGEAVAVGCGSVETVHDRRYRRTRQRGEMVPRRDRVDHSTHRVRLLSRRQIVWSG